MSLTNLTHLFDTRPPPQTTAELRGQRCFACGNVKEGGHYNLIDVPRSLGMQLLRDIFPDGDAGDLNFVLFSTSGVHGSYQTIEETKIGDDVTFLVVAPRLVRLHYGNAIIGSRADKAFLKKLRRTSHASVARIGLASDD